MINEAIARIRRMEQCFDAVQEDAERGDQLQLLIRYYESGQWLHDYELDEQGLLPSDLKRGVLAQDAVYDLLEQIARNKNTEDKKMQITIDALEAYLSEQYSGWANEQGLFMKLVEEIGEVAEVLNRKTGRKADGGSDLREELGNELADMIHYIVAIAAVNDLDLNDIILRKDKKASVKYHHEIDLETFIETIPKFV